MTIGVNLNYGFYFNYSDRITEEISLFDITETTDKLEVSVRLFIPLILTWEVIKTFIEEGRTYKQIQWINADNLPENSRFY